MNLDDLLCVGATDNILLSSTIGECVWCARACARAGVRARARVRSGWEGFDARVRMSVSDFTASTACLLHQCTRECVHTNIPSRTNPQPATPHHTLCRIKMFLVDDRTYSINTPPHHTTPCAV